MRRTVLLALLLASGCTVAEPDAQAPPPVAVGGSLPASPLPSPSAAARLPGDDRPLSRHVAAVFPGSKQVWSVSTLDALVDPADPLKFTPAERARLRKTLAALVGAEDELAARSALLAEVLGEAWRRPDLDMATDAPMPEDAFEALYPLVVAELTARAAGRTATAGAVRPELLQEEAEDEAEPVAEDAFPRRPDEIAVVLQRLAPGLAPEAAARARAELQAMQPPVQRMAAAWEDVVALVATPERTALLGERARALTGRTYDSMETADRVRAFLKGS